VKSTAWRLAHIVSVYCLTQQNMKTRLGEIQLIDWIINKDLRKDDSQWKELLKETRLSLFRWSVKVCSAEGEGGPVLA